MMNYQALPHPIPGTFSVYGLFTSQGIEQPTNRQFHYMRQWLRDHGYKFQRVHGRDEYWYYAPDEKIDPQIFTPETFFKKYFPGIDYKNVDRLQTRKIMQAYGLRYRSSFGYWSPKLQQRKHIRKKFAKARPPTYLKIPPGSFCILDLLELNKMRRYPENFVWARQELAKRGVHKIYGTNRYAAPNARGTLPATVTGNWQAPGPVFTTYQFQELNNAKKPTQEEWKSALAWLEANQFKFDPKWKRWKRQ